ncbi:hypothetical protein OAF54_00010 [bacterium]|nr:hypothetical protein [bacterium]
MRIETWSQQQASEEFLIRLERSRKARKTQEDVWKENESTVYGGDRGVNGGMGIDDVTGFDFDGGNASDSEININYTFNYIRFLHAQLSSNPPTSLPVPTSQDLKDRTAAKVADQLINHGRREYNAQEFLDATTLDTMIYGTGWGRCSWCPTKGEIRAIDGDEVTLEGDFDISNPSIWDVHIDPEADRWQDVRYIFIRHFMPEEEAIAKWPQHKDAIKAIAGKRKKDKFYDSALNKADDYDSTLVEIFEYIEKGLPWNGGVGRYVWGLETGLLLTDLDENPYPEHALPIAPITDIDVPHTVYGKSIVEYLSRGQEVLSALDSTILDNIQSHGVVRLVLPDGAKIQDEGINNNGWEYVEIAGNAGGAPFFMNPPALMPDIYRFREQLLAGMETIAGINENMMGKQSREMSGFSMQTAINAGNMVRRRLFNKYTAFVNWFWTTYLSTIQEKWDTPRTVLVTGEEEALSLKKFRGSDIDGGFDIQTDYGTSFSLDPASRREEIMQLAPMFEKAGISPKKVLEKLQLNEIKGIFDIMDLARKRQVEIFEEMIDKSGDGMDVYIAPEELEEHAGMLEAAYEFVMMRRYRDLEDDVKTLIVRHIKEREALAAQTAAPAQEAAPGAGMPMGGAAPAAPAPMPM